MLRIKIPFIAFNYDKPLGFEKSDHHDKTVEVEGPLEEVNLGDNQHKRVTYISSLLVERFKSQLYELLREYKDYFA
jgi:hypothetical protein